MDPNACYQRWLNARTSGDQEEAKEAWYDLQRWLVNGGFPPDWTAKQEHDWWRWGPR